MHHEDWLRLIGQIEAYYNGKQNIEIWHDNYGTMIDSIVMKNLIYENSNTTFVSFSPIDLTFSLIDTVNYSHMNIICHGYTFETLLELIESHREKVKRYTLEKYK